MAIVTNTWNIITLFPAANAAWTGYTPPFPSLPSDATAALIGAGVTAMRVFCIDDSGPLTLAYAGGTVILDASVIAKDSAITMDITNMDDGDTWYSIRNGTEWLYYSYIKGQVYTLADSTTLGAFIS